MSPIHLFYHYLSKSCIIECEWSFWGMILGSIKASNRALKVFHLDIIWCWSFCLTHFDCPLPQMVIWSTVLTTFNRLITFIVIMFTKDPEPWKARHPISVLSFVTSFTIALLHRVEPRWTDSSEVVKVTQVPGIFLSLLALVV